MGTSNYDTRGSNKVYVIDDGSHECPTEGDCEECEYGRQEPIDVDWFVELVKTELGETGDYDYEVSEGSTSIAQLNTDEEIELSPEYGEEEDGYQLAHYTTVVYRHGYYDGCNADIEIKLALEGNGEYYDVESFDEIPEEIVEKFDSQSWDAYKIKCEAAVEKARAVIVKYTSELTVLGHMSNGGAAYVKS